MQRTDGKHDNEKNRQGDHEHTNLAIRGYVLIVHPEILQLFARNSEFGGLLSKKFLTIVRDLPVDTHLRAAALIARLVVRDVGFKIIPDLRATLRRAKFDKGVELSLTNIFY